MRYLKLLLFILLLTSCASSGTKVEKTELCQIKEGETTKAEVIEMIGNPASVSLDSEGNELFIYSYAHVSPSARNFIPVVNILSQQYNHELQQVIILFDDDGIVKKMTSNISKNKTKAGLVDVD